MRWVVVIGLMAACSSEQAPTCEQAFGRYFGAGCTWGDDQPLAVAVCQTVAQQYPVTCREDLEAWLRCLDEATPAARCDCAAEQAELARCGG